MTDAFSQTCTADQCPAVKVYGSDEAAICRAWATEAVGQQLENEQSSCGETGDNWHFDIKLHFRICKGLSPLDREQFAETRRKKMVSCRQTPKKTGASSPSNPSTDAPAAKEETVKTDGKPPEWDEYCRKSYMIDALKVARTAKDWNCTDADPELHQRREQHYNFCVREAPNGAGDYPLHDLIGERQEKIEACKQKSANKKEITREVRVRRRACSRFADIFLNAKLENDRLKCAYQGDDWHTNWNAHYRSCTGLERSDRLKRINDRQSAMRDCRGKIFPEGQLAADDPNVKPDIKDEGRGGPSEAVRKACDAYAKEAVAHQAANQQLGCGFSGDLWALKEAVHFNSCTTSRADFAFKSNMARDAKLRQCTAVRLCQDPTRATTLFCQDLTGLVPPGASEAPKPDTAADTKP